MPLCPQTERRLPFPRFGHVVELSNGKSVDAGQIRFHVRANPGTRIETTEQLLERVEDVVHSVVPEDEIVTVIDNLGMPISGLNLALGDTSVQDQLDRALYYLLMMAGEPVPELPAACVASAEP